MIVELDLVSKRYGDTWALRNVELQMKPGQIIAVTGENGAGKTTMLQMLAGLISPDRGDVLLGGHPFKRADAAMRKRIYFMPDAPAVPYDVSIIEYAGILLKAYGKPLNDADVERLAEAWHQLDVIEKVEYAPDHLSRGQLYKSVLALVDFIQPAVYLLDEPFASGMDAKGIAYFERQSKTLAESGSIVIFTTQLLSVAERLADTACILNKGRVSFFGAVDQVPASMLSDLLFNAEASHEDS